MAAALHRLEGRPELAPGQKVEEALRAFDRYDVAYQPAQPLASIKQQRFFATG